MEKEVGKVRDYFAKIGVAGIELSDNLRVSDTIHIKGHTTDLTQTVGSMQIEHENVEEARAGDSIGVKVSDRVRPGDTVYVVSEEKVG